MVPFFQDDFFLFVILFWKGLDSPNNTIHDCTVRNRGPEQENNKKTTRKQTHGREMWNKHEENEYMLVGKNYYTQQRSDTYPTNTLLRWTTIDNVPTFSSGLFGALRVQRHTPHMLFAHRNVAFARFQWYHCRMPFCFVVTASAVFAMVSRTTNTQMKSTKSIP